jgi:hypothetical protein
MLTGTDEHEEIIERIAALDIGKAELMVLRAGGCACLSSPDRI